MCVIYMDSVHGRTCKLEGNVEMSRMYDSDKNEQSIHTLGGRWFNWQHSALHCVINEIGFT
jgi:hypothetical protein